MKFSLCVKVSLWFLFSYQLSHDIRQELSCQTWLKPASHTANVLKLSYTHAHTQQRESEKSTSLWLQCVMATPFSPSRVMSHGLHPGVRHGDANRHKLSQNNRPVLTERINKHTLWNNHFQLYACIHTWHLVYVYYGNDPMWPSQSPDSRTARGDLEFQEWCDRRRSPPLSASTMRGSILWNIPWDLKIFCQLLVDRHLTSTLLVFPLICHHLRPLKHKQQHRVTLSSSSTHPFTPVPLTASSFWLIFPRCLHIHSAQSSSEQNKLIPENKSTN